MKFSTIYLLELAIMKLTIVNPYQAVQMPEKVPFEQDHDRLSAKQEDLTFYLEGMRKSDV